MSHDPRPARPDDGPQLGTPGNRRILRRRTGWLLPSVALVCLLLIALWVGSELNIPEHVAGEPGRPPPPPPEAAAPAEVSPAPAVLQEPVPRSAEPPTPPAEPAPAPSGPDSASTPRATAATAKMLNEEMLDVAGRTLADFSQDADAIGLMGMAQNRSGNSARAMDYWEKCVRLDPDRADVYDAMGIVALKKGQFEQAAALWRKALQRAPSAPGVHYRLARALLRLGNLEEAAAELEADIKITPDASRSYLLLGQTYLQLKQHDKARDSYQAVLRIDPGETDAYYGLAMVCQRLGEAERAEKYRQQFKTRREAYWKTHVQQRSRASDLPEMRRAVAQTYAEAGRIYRRHGRIGSAERLWQRAAAVDPDNTQCRQELARLYRAGGKLPQALQICQQLNRIQPANPTYYLNIGALCAAMKRFDQAQRAYQSVVSLTPQSSTGYRALAGLYLNFNRQLARAKTLAAEAVRLEATAENYHVLSIACQKNGDRPGALAAIGRATELQPDNAKYRLRRKQLQERK